MNGDTLVLTAQDVASSLDLRACVDAIERALRRHDAGRSLGPTSLGLTRRDGSFHVKAAGLTVDGRSFIAAKANMNLPGNPAARGLPTIQGALTLFDADTGAPLALMDSIVITSVRTGAATAVAARHLAVADASVVTIIGCGEQGDIQLRSVAAVRPIRRVWAIDMDRRKAREYAARMSRDLAITVECTEDVRFAIADSDICVTCTTSSTPVVTAEDAHPGLFVAAIGADNPRKQELDPQMLAQARVVVDSLEACAANGELHHALAAGVMARDGVHAELSAVVSGRAPGRKSDAEVFVFDSTGTALFDVAAAVVAYTNARTAGRGMPVRLGPR